MKKFQKDLIPPEAKVVCVGDVSLDELLEAGVVPDVAIVDGKVMRKFRGVRRLEGFEVVKVHNDPGTISGEAWEALEKALEKEKVQIIVEGEEDLLALPAIYLAPLGSVVVYGQPKEGMVVVFVDNSKKEVAKNLLRRFDEG